MSALDLHSCLFSFLNVATRLGVDITECTFLVVGVMYYLTLMYVATSNVTFRTRSLPG